MDAVDAGLAALSEPLAAAAQTVPSSRELRHLFDARHADADAAKVAINALHFAIVAALSASDPSLAKAYGLGRALADTVRAPENTADLRERFHHYRLENLRS